MARGVYLRKQPLRCFWEKVKFSENGCWEWTGAIDFGYGKFWDGHKMQRAHRYSYETLTGNAIPIDKCLDHLCRNRKCVNPVHLEVVTNRENILRGIGITAQQARLTHCKRGHPYDSNNTYYQPKGSRVCKICQRIIHRQRRLLKSREGVK